MKIVHILGGLGNQMFQYAFAYALSKKEDNVKLDTDGFSTYDLRKYELDIFNVSLELAGQHEISSLKYQRETFIQKIIRRLRKKSKPLANIYYKEPHFHFDQNALRQTGNRYFKGYWQSEKYFVNYREELLKEFSLKEELSAEINKYIEQIKHTPSVSLHIRRGDYVTNRHTNSVHGTCSLAYYKKAVRHIEDKVETPHFYIFSDDLFWAKEHLSFVENITYIELDKTVPDYEEMILMSYCRHNIIANSSFSWWGAWLNQNEDKMVIAPQKWFNDKSLHTKDLIPSIWIKL